MATKFNIFSSSGSGKGLSIFDSKKYKEHEQAPVARKFWNIRALAKFSQITCLS